MQYKVLLLGASGLTGRYCLNLLLSDSRVAAVKSLGRRTLDLQHQKLSQFTFDQLSESEADAFNVDAVICCLGTTIKKAGSPAAFKAIDYDLVVEMAAKAAKQGVKTFAVVSAINAKANSASFYARIKGQMENTLKELPFNRLVLARPSLLLGQRSEKRLLEDIGQLSAKPLVPLMSRFKLASTPIQAEQLAKALVNAALQQDKEGVLVLRYADLIQYASQ